ISEIADEVRHHIVKRLTKRLNYIEEYLKDKTYFLGDNFSIVDAYAYSILASMPRFSVDLLQWRNISVYMQQLNTRESIIKALDEERMFIPV
ncbi:MAG: glutathione binding-like protein, partial [Shewanella sp.]